MGTLDRAQVVKNRGKDVALGETFPVHTAIDGTHRRGGGLMGPVEVRHRYCKLKRNGAKKDYMILLISPSWKFVGV